MKSSEEMWLLRYVLLVTMLEGMAFARSEVEQFKAVQSVSVILNLSEHRTAWYLEKGRT